MGAEDWESKYKVQLSELLDKEENRWAEDDVILRMGRALTEPSGSSLSQSTQRSGILPATYPAGYDIIDQWRMSLSPLTLHSSARREGSWCCGRC
ncbi:unnamed protein product [Coregonus sp. 'balchen']|nr:unnamed protein product [Coregonus sp. 'balchen']